MIAVINVVAGAGIALLARLLIPSSPRWMDAAAGVAAAVALTLLFYAYQRLRFGEIDVRSPERVEK